MSNDRVNSVREKFIEVYGAAPKSIIRAAGRVNLIGEHTDYNDGFVLPIAIDRDVLVAVSPRNDSVVNLYSLNFEGKSSFALDADIVHDNDNKWSNYMRGVAVMLQAKGITLTGADIAVEGNVPLGSGLSSSAALEVATAMAFQAINGFEMSGPDMALLAQAAENKFVGVNCGIMDQFISRLGAKDHALFIDCRSLDYELVPLPSSGVKVIVGNTMKKRGLVDSEYNARRSQCEEAVEVLKNYLPGITALRDVTPADMAKYGDKLSPIVGNRAEFVVSEDDRVLRSVVALKAGDIELFGQLMNESHEAARDLYEISCDELNVMVESAWAMPGVYGSRMTGAGFGGCTVSLVKDEAVESFLERVPKEYEAKTGIKPAMYVCAPEDGAKILE